jgi:hypothetical protein
VGFQLFGPVGPKQVFALESANLVGMRVRRWVLVGAAFAGTAVAALRQRLLAHNERRPETR